MHSLLKVNTGLLLLLCSSFFAGNAVRLGDDEDSATEAADRLNSGGGNALYLVLGPMACGKSKTEAWIQERDDNSKIMAIDDYVENDPEYKKNVRVYLNSVCNQCRTPKATRTKLKHEYEEDRKGHSSFVGDFGLFYFGSRQNEGKHPLTKKQIIGCGRSDGGCLADFNEDQDAAFLRGASVIQETTGTRLKYVKKMLDRASEENYEIIITMNILQFSTLENRFRGRNVNSIVAFMNDRRERMVPAPRLPPIGHLAQNVVDFLEVAGHLINCVLQTETQSTQIINTTKLTGREYREPCPDHHISRVLVFHNEHDHRLVFDSSSGAHPEELQPLLESMVPPSDKL